METTTIHPAETYLRNAANPPYLYVRIGGKRRKLFINRDMNVIGIMHRGNAGRAIIFQTGRP